MDKQECKLSKTRHYITGQIEMLTYLSLKSYPSYHFNTTFKGYKNLQIAHYWNIKRNILYLFP